MQRHNLNSILNRQLQPSFNLAEHDDLWPGSVSNMAAPRGAVGGAGRPRGWAARSEERGLVQAVTGRCHLNRSRRCTATAERCIMGRGKPLVLLELPGPGCVTVQQQPADRRDRGNTAASHQSVLYSLFSEKQEH